MLVTQPDGVAVGPVVAEGVAVGGGDVGPEVFVGDGGADVCVAVGKGVRVGVREAVGVRVGVLLSVVDAVAVWLGLGVGETVGVCVSVAPGVGDSVSEAVVVIVGVSEGSLVTVAREVGGSTMGVGSSSVGSGSFGTMLESSVIGAAVASKPDREAELGSMPSSTMNVPTASWTLGIEVPNIAWEVTTKPQKVSPKISGRISAPRYSVRRQDPFLRRVAGERFGAE